MLYTRPILLAVTFLLAAAAAAPAGPIYSADITNGAGVSGSPTPVTLTSALNQGNGARGNGIVVSSSHLAGYVETSAVAAGAFQSSIAFSANMTATYDDIFIIGPRGTVPVTLHVPFDAVLTQNWSAVTFAGSNDASSVNQGAFLFASLTTPGAGLSFGQFDLRIPSDQANSAHIGILERGGVSFQAGPTPGPPSSDSHGAVTVFQNLARGDVPGFLYLDRVLSAITVPDTGAGPGVGLSFDDAISLHGEILMPLTATVGTPLTLRLGLSINSFASGAFSTGAFGSIDALHTFGVRQGGLPVFDLPDGYTAESQSLNIVNNVVPSATSAVPEPSSIIHFGTILLGLVALRKQFAPDRVAGHRPASMLP